MVGEARGGDDVSDAKLATLEFTKPLHRFGGCDHERYAVADGASCTGGFDHLVDLAKFRIAQILFPERLGQKSASTWQAEGPPNFHERPLAAEWVECVSHGNRLNRTVPERDPVKARNGAMRNRSSSRARMFAAGSTGHKVNARSVNCRDSCPVPTARSTPGEPGARPPRFVTHATASRV